MASKRSRASAAAAPNATARTADGRNRVKSSSASSSVRSPAANEQEDVGQHSKSWDQLFSAMASGAARYAGHPMAFLTTALLVIAWAVTGPLFNFSDTWQLVINTSTTIVTFLMVFLIQHTQNRDTLAVQLKLAELIIAVKGAENRLATAEDLSEKELEQLHEDYRHRADEALDHLERRRAQLKHAS
jgi:low affinity Fe/Cu permease